MHNVLQPQETAEDELLREEIEKAISSSKLGNSAGIDNIPVEIIQAAGEPTIDMLHQIYDKLWQTGQWPKPWTKPSVISQKRELKTLPELSNPVSIISHSSKVMLKVILNRVS
ncbi:endonuclease-reverse transcriptase [Plakobranchus ocellatus]|uniref:Endonuclease-reverse transcriptase n=1 Tax=Plakobranchus ocellatus TaxID=259542 RepID=A0AAV4AQU4_9GAST|nr:endonuclease-reverse transcriptase [Plakobranchus ocellatus]